MELLKPHFSLLFWTIVGFLIFLFWLIALISILKADFKDSTTKLMWVIVVFLLPVIGSILYFAIGRDQRINNN